MPALSRERPNDGVFEIGPYGHPLESFTLLDPHSEVWEAIRSFTLEARFIDVAMREHGKTRSEARRAFREARYYLIQAAEFEAAAAGASHRAKPLLDYYSMLNLAKFVVSVRRPDLLSERNPRHGLGFGPGARDGGVTVRQIRLTSSTGVFSSLVTMLTGQAPPATFTLDDVMARIVDIGLEYQAGWGSASRLQECFATYRLSYGASEGWLHLELVCRRGEWPTVRRRLGWPGSPVLRMHRVKSDDEAAVHLESVPFAFRPDYPREAVLRVAAELQRMGAALADFDTPVFSRRRRRRLVVPWKPRTGAPLPEMAAIYAMAFYLSDVVRYRPHLYDNSVITNDQWVLNTFGRVAARKFAQLALNLIMQREHRFTRY